MSLAGSSSLLFLQKMWATCAFESRLNPTRMRRGLFHFLQRHQPDHLQPLNTITYLQMLKTSGNWDLLWSRDMDQRLSNDDAIFQGLVLKQPQKYSNLHSTLTSTITEDKTQLTQHVYYSCTQAARSMARSTIQLLFGSWPSSTVFVQKKRDLNTVETNICRTKNMWQNDLSKTFHVMSIETISATIPLQHPSEPSLSRSHWLHIRPFCSWETEGRRFHPAGLWSFPPTSTSSAAFQKGWGEEYLERLFRKTFKNIDDVSEICLY